MGSFEWDFNGHHMRFIDEDGRVKRERVYVHPKSGKHSWITEYPIDHRDAPGVRALLANRAEVMALYREAMDNARRWAEVLDGNMGSNARISKLDSLDARFKKMDVGQ